MGKVATLAVIIFCTIINAAAQFLLKLGATRTLHAISDEAPKNLPFAVLRHINIYIVSGMAIYGIAALLWIKILSLVPLSYAVPFSALTIVLTILLSVLVLREPFPGLRMLGTLLIVAGIVCIAKSY